MKRTSMLIESTAVAGFFLLGLWLRMAHLEREAVEHFDEGIYASVLWYDGEFNAPYPARQFYALPLISTMMAFSAGFLGSRVRSLPAICTAGQHYHSGPVVARPELVWETSGYLYLRHCCVERLSCRVLPDGTD